MQDFYRYILCDKYIQLIFIAGISLSINAVMLVLHILRKRGYELWAMESKWF